MKNLVRTIMSSALVAGLFALTVPMAPRAAATSAPKQNEKQRTVRDSKIKTGPEVAAKVNALRERNKNVRAALKALENSGRKPKIDKSVAISGIISEAVSKKSRASVSRSIVDRLFKKASYAAQETVVRDENGYEAIFVPVLDTYDDWQGTVIATKYDQYGYQVDQYVFDVALRRDYANEGWESVFEVSYWGGYGHLEWERGMIEDQFFQWGVPLNQQANYDLQQQQLNGQSDGMTQPAPGTERADRS